MFFCGYFNPRTPCGVRLYRACQRKSFAEFQSTHPLRGATESRRSPAETGLISIHAPLAGCDRRTCHADVTDQISIHAPLAGCDQPGWQDQEAGWISIHAPLAGCDCISLRPCHTKANFNPRTPCGVRPVAVGHAVQQCAHFNPRTPCGVRHNAWTALATALGFQSTHPLRGATYLSIYAII